MKRYWPEKLPGGQTVWKCKNCDPGQWHHSSAVAEACQAAGPSHGSLHRSPDPLAFVPEVVKFRRAPADTRRDNPLGRR